MRHELDVVAIVTAEFGELVGKILAAGEVLLEAGETAAERMAARVDNTRVGQHQVYESQVQEIVWQLVDEEGAAVLALDSGAREIVLTERAQLGRLQGRQSFRVAHAVGPARAHRMGHGGNVGQLHGAFDLRVTRQDLLDERGARAWQADDEDRIRVGSALVCTCGEELAREKRARTREMLTALGRVVMDLGAPQAVTLPVVLEGGAVVLLILETLTKCEMKVIP